LTYRAYLITSELKDKLKDAPIAGGTFFTAKNGVLRSFCEKQGFLKVFGLPE
jgi:hypothetical protein